MKGKGQTAGAVALPFRFVALCVALCIAVPGSPAPAAPGLNIRIIGTASFQGRSTALIEDLNSRTDSFYRVGDTIYGYSIVAISSSGVQVKKDDKTLTIKIASVPAGERHAPLNGNDSVAGTLLPRQATQSAGLTADYYTSMDYESATRWDLFTPRAPSGTGKRPDVAGDMPMTIALPAPAATSLNRFVVPVANYKRLSSPFGMRIHPIRKTKKMHKGLDFSANRGTRILASDNGIVTFSGWKGGYGYTVMIDHQNGYKTLYGHCSKLLADVGDNVRRGDFIAEVGSTGASTGNHLHFEIHRRDNPVDPAPFLPDL